MSGRAKKHARSWPLVELAVEHKDWNAALPDLADALQQAASMAFEVTGQDATDRAVSVLATSDQEIAKLNGEFRDKAKPTNVLSWPANPLSPAETGAAPGDVPETLPERAVWDDPDEPLLIGDLAIALETCQREAAARAISLRAHLVHLTLHGCLHLMGYDHQTDEDADLMEGLEKRALLAAGFHDPYEIITDDGAGQ